MLSDALTQHEQLRNGALQEAAFYRAKLAAFESGSSLDIVRVESDRAGQLESKLAALSADYAAQEAKLLELREAFHNQSRMREHAEIRVQEASQRLEELEDLRRKLTSEHVDLHTRHEILQRTIQNHAERLISQSSVLEQREAEYNFAKSRLDALDTLQQQHLQFVEQTQSTLDISSSRLSEITTQWESATQRISELESELAETKMELESRATEASAATVRLAQVENAWAQSREEADALRSLTTQRLGELLDSHRDLRADEDRLLDSHNEKVRALEVELSSLRSLHEEVDQNSEQNQLALSQMRQQNQEFEVDRSTLKSQIMGLRAQLSDSVSETGKLRQELLATQKRATDYEIAFAKSESKFSMLNRYLEENGLNLDGGTFGDTLSTSIGMHENQSSKKFSSDREFESLRARHQEALQQISSLTLELQQSRLKPEVTTHAQQEQVEELRQALAGSEKAHQERMRQLETDYQTAVHYVK